MIGKPAQVFLAALALMNSFLPAAAAELKVAIGQRGNWDTSITELGLRAGIFKNHGLDLELLYTQGGGETQQAVLSRSVDIGVAVGTLGVLGVASKGAPLRIIGGEATGVGELYWYVPVASPIKTIADLQGRTIAYSTNGSSSHSPLLLLGREQKLNLDKLVATGGLPGTYTQVMSGQIDVGWAAAPFGLDQLGKTTRIVFRGIDVVGMRNQTSRVLITHAGVLAQKKAAVTAYLAAYRETIDWMHASDEAIPIYAAFAGVSEEAAKRTRDEFFSKAALDPGTLVGLPEMMADAVQFKFLQAPLTQEQLAQIIQIERKSP
ncbi:NitT/TauT family transport system substrate-binding protein [Bosea sp. AK1]|uniref:ABC transporter substrate-binding protein n=1 Tax=Bosea sp. AK1 TaxID=2587160 RepID=UPI00116DEFD6|nr:ABC transporter substrate-binding protein [Bosea sp. AK1]TQI65344.1 NitT/TauT family transport system substrate-binding protein [Bosea sp. AK1]